jgi:hypothetical protein
MVKEKAPRPPEFLLLARVLTTRST